MKNRPLLYLLAVILVGTSIWFWERPDVAPTGDAQTIVFFPKFEPLKVQKLQISHLLEGVTLQKNEGAWTATSNPTELSAQVAAQSNTPETTPVSVVADSWKVGAALIALHDLESQSLISRDATIQPRMQVNGMGTHVLAYDAAGQLLADITLGKVGPDLVSTYARRGSEPEVYLAKGYLTSQFPAVAEKWKPNEKVDPDKSHSATNGHALPGRQ